MSVWRSGQMAISNDLKQAEIAAHQRQGTETVH
jgi:hypothetical protein